MVGQKPMTESDIEVMTIENPRWKEFCERLDSALSKRPCDAQTLRQATKVLRDMGGIDIDASLEYFREHGGYCDCEIFCNVDPGFWAGPPETDTLH
jgi:hypothetical protein